MFLDQSTLPIGSSFPDFTNNGSKCLQTLSHNYRHKLFWLSKLFRVEKKRLKRLLKKTSNLHFSNDGQDLGTTPIASYYTYY